MFPQKDRAYHLVYVAHIGLSAFPHLPLNTSLLKFFPVSDSGQLGIRYCWMVRHWAVKRQNVFTVFDGMCLGFFFSELKFPVIETPSSLEIFQLSSTVRCVKKAGCA